MIAVGITGIGLVGPGLPDWNTGAALLREPAAWRPEATVVPPPARLPPTERRRAGIVVKASMDVADQAVAMAGLEVATLATVFASSTGDPLNCHQLCEALAAPVRTVSPTRFTNSVHNAPAGYWHIACASRAPSTSLAAFDASLAAALLEAAVQCHTSQAPVLLVVCDAPYPQPLHAVRTVADTLAVALVFEPPGRGRALQLDVVAQTDATPCAHAGLEALRQSIPAARALPLLQALAGTGGGRVVLEGLPGMSVRVELGR